MSLVLKKCILCSLALASFNSEEKKIQNSWIEESQLDNNCCAAE